MRLAIICIDTRGGVQPYLGLGLGLSRAGHEVRIAAPEGFRGFVESNGLRFVGLPGEAEGVMQTPEVRAAMEKGFLATHKLMIEKAGHMFREQMQSLLAACEGSDAILGGFGGMLSGEAVAEKLGVPFIQAHVQPLTPTGVYPGLLSMRGLRWCGPANRLSHEISRQAFWQPLRGAVNTARKAVLGLPPTRFWGNVGRVRKQDDLILYGYSPSLLPRSEKWPVQVVVTGYWFLDRTGEWVPPPGLSEFLAAGPPPIAVGFGSMGSSDAELTAKLILDAIEKTNQRVVLLSGWGGMSASDLPSWAFKADSVPHDWLYPQCAAAVHHGGAGTTGAALRAGIPSVVIPFAADQPFWGWLMTQKKLGDCPAPRKRLTSDRLAKSILKILGDNEVRNRSAEMGNRIRTEDGVASAVEAIEAWSRRGKQPTITDIVK
jgi:sterol 3beta-glucosyltransferase